ncbi:dnaJ homolog subfamily C member 30, mitochondrial-like isoform X2 [Plodia interpunctella]|uniref:dnaJ homolog subfamily C member 30, mitochondrial-like isoform X2 n=1 Tax=Plodia interpunctella TaxID=58824 RepID=UPI0023683EB2|nr:dnaJ homolog subfamily C member 30, mitochondrial-like isoform X2 [Plodia interpunctella]
MKLANIEMLNNNKLRLISGILRSVSTSCWNYSNHYDALGVTPKATQSEIKSAYYKLSKIYHPDKSDDEASAKKFRAITEAYEVLGNIKLKKMYDRGLIVGRHSTSRVDYHGEPEPTDPNLKFHKSRAKRHVAPTLDGKMPIYDFDAWAKNHYGDLFKKAKYDREIIKQKKAKRQAISETTHQEAMLYLVFAICGLFLMFVVNGTADYDKDLIKRNTENQTDQESKPDQQNEVH